MSSYTKNTNFTAIDALPSGPAKRILGTAWDAEFAEIQTVCATKVDIADGTLTGTAAFAALNLASTLTGSGLLTGTQSKLTTPAAFYAKEAFTNIPTNPNPQTLVPQSIMANYASGYSASTGLFTAPYAGVYTFSGHATLYNNALTTGLVLGWIGLRLNGATMLATSNRIMTPSGGGVHLYGGCTVSVTVQLAAGDTVDLYVECTTSGQFFEYIYNYYFSGALVART